jgi:NAD(P)-dependent dehydrogenase (short-subunit alcohol dehydrogenase family)
MVADLKKEEGCAVVEAITGAGGRAKFTQADVTRAEDCRRVVKLAVQAFGGLEILINNAGIIRRTTVLNMTEEQWDWVMAVNVRSIFLMSKYAIPPMVLGGGGAIVNMASGWGLVGGRNAVSYCASKGAVVNMTRAMALDHADQGIRVNCICPGDADTPMLREEARQLGEPEAQFLASSADRPLRRIGTPEDIAQAALYLASEAAAFVTGTALVVDGGGLAG